MGMSPPRMMSEIVGNNVPILLKRGFFLMVSSLSTLDRSFIRKNRFDWKITENEPVIFKIKHVFV
jgi:hypothetical protein